MTKSLLLLCVLFLSNIQLAEFGKHPEYNLEKLFKLSLKSLDKVTSLMQDAADSDVAGENEYVFDLHDLSKSGRTGPKSKPKETTNSSKGTTPVSVSATTSKPSTSKPSTTKTPTSTSPLANIYLNRTNFKPTTRSIKHLKKREVTEKLPPKKEHQTLRMRERAILLRIKAAAYEMESLLQRFISMLKNGTQSPASTPMPTTQAMQTYPDVSQTTAEPYPEAYQGYNPVISANMSQSNKSSRNSSLVLNSIRKRRSLKNRRLSRPITTNTRWRRIPKEKTNSHPQHRPKTKILMSKTKSLPKMMKLANGARTKGYQMTVLKSSNCSKSGPVLTDILKTMWSMRKMIHKLSKAIDRDVRKLGNQGVDNTNEQRADIKSNGDRISQMQTGLSGKIDDIRYNISSLMMSQRELGKSVSIALESMMGILNQMVAMITKRDNQIENRVETEAIIANNKPDIQEEVNNATKIRGNEINSAVSKTGENLATNSNFSNTTSADNSKLGKLVTTPVNNNKAPENTYPSDVTMSPRNRTNLESTTKHPNLVTKGELDGKSVSPPNNIHTVTNRVKPSRHKGPPKKIQLAKSYKQKVQKQNKKQKGRKPNEKPKVGHKHKRYEAGQMYGKLNAGNPYKILKDKGSHEKVAKPQRRTPKYGEEYRKPKVGNTHKLLKWGKLHRKRNILKASQKLGVEHINGKQNTKEPSKKQKGGNPQEKLKLGKSHNTQTSKSGKASFHNDHAVLNKFKNNKYHSNKVKSQKAHQHQHHGNRGHTDMKFEQ